MLHPFSIQTREKNTPKNASALELHWIKSIYPLHAHKILFLFLSFYLLERSEISIKSNAFDKLRDVATDFRAKVYRFYLVEL